MSTETAPESASQSSPQKAGLTVFLETFGCQMNVLDSQLVQGQLRGLGYRFIDDWKHADVVLYNTCSVRERAEQKVWSRVGEVGVHKKNHPDVLLGVIGCMAERDGEDTIRKYPQVDLLCGPGELDKLPLLIDNAVRTGLEKRGGLRAAKIALQGDTHRRSATLAAAGRTPRMRRPTSENEPGSPAQFVSDLTASHAQEEADAAGKRSHRDRDGAGAART